MSFAVRTIDMTDLQPKIRRALISVSDKNGIVDLAQGLTAHDVEIVSTGGTAQVLRKGGLVVRDVGDLTGFPEMMDGRVKTLHPKIHGGLLAIRGNANHQRAQDEHDIGNIDLLIVNLYPFEETVASGAGFEASIENIDIGGPALIRAAAKNHQSVTVLIDPADYSAFLQAMDRNDGAVDIDFRRQLAAKAYARTAAYDAAIGNWFAAELSETSPKNRSFSGTLAETLRYGENPHQWAAFYKTPADRRPGIATAEQIQGKELSFNNLNDTDAAYELVAEFDPAASAAIAIIKHANPCGVALGATLKDAYLAALKCDPVSAFGGIVALNRPVDADAAREIVKIFTEVIIAPDANSAAREIIGAKKNLRLLLAGALPDASQEGLSIRTVSGGFLVQSRDNGQIDKQDLKVVTKRQPTDQEMSDLKFAFRVCKHVKSNAIIYAKDNATVGVGAGQMSRVDSARIAAWKAEAAAKEAGHRGSLAEGSVAASDAFFPFADGLLTTAEAGVTAIIQPGGSMRDDEVIAAADEKNLAMVFT
ncbi:MAG: bifunctional phosphoribosylaminoimidazolecarboxamide formyltransferase/IMP cyclohydrolase, partial [Methyloligellaceae bacterium]